MLVKEQTAPAFIKTGSKKPNGHRVATNLANELSTSSLAWLLVKRHKFAIMLTGDIVLVLNWVTPFWFDTAKQLVRSIIQ